MIAPEIPAIQRKLSFDSRCYDLAESFIEDGPIAANHKERCNELAQCIQNTIEDWIEANPPQFVRRY